MRFRVVSLIFNHSVHCAACQAALPHLDEFARLHRLSCTVLRVQGDDLMEKLTDWVPKGTPAYVLKVDGKVIGKWTGAMSIDELEAWVEKILASKREAPLAAAS